MENTSDMIREFTFELLKDITNNFSKEHEIGSGGYGRVYKGVLENGEEIAIKKLYYMPGLDDTQFRNEFNNLMRAQHQNIIRLVGYCYHLGHQFIMHNGEYVFAHVEERVLCFEYLPSGSLDKYISEESSGFDWCTRYKIIKGVCEGLNYLHNGYKYPISHMDLKPANVLLDKDMTPKIGDFGLSRLFPSAHTYTTVKIIGTPGYMPPEYIEKYEITAKFDVFSLGVIIIRIVAGNEGYSKRANMSSQEFVDHVYENWRKRMLGIMPSHTSQEVMTCIELALRCLESDRVRRPAISEIVTELNKIDTVESSPIIQRLDVGDVEDNYGLEYSDDEPIVSAARSDTRVQLVIKKYINKAPLDTNNYKVMLELIGSGSAGDRLGLDLVVILDVSVCMLGKKIHEMKSAMKFIIDKLSPIDRLSIVTFSAAAARLCPLHLVTETSQSELKELIAGLTAGVDAANISAGLQTGLKVLADRRVSRGRAVAVMIMADGLQINRGNLITIDSNDVPVYTFSLGMDHDPTVLHEVADNSKGGTFSAVILDMHGRCPELDFCLDKLLTVVSQDLRLTVACVGEESTTVIKVITAGSYPQTQDAHHGLVTISLGDLYSRAVHWVTVDLLLPAVESDHNMDILEVTYTYSTCGELFVAPPSRLTVWCTSSGMGKEKTLPLPVEETCLQQMAKKPWTEATRSPSDLSCSYTQRAPARAQGDYDLLVKLLLVGDSSVGKSKLLLQFSDAAFTTNFLTIGIDFKIRTVELDGKRIKLQIWDTAGQERFRTITTAYYRGAMGILLVYDVADESSFNNIRLWKKNVEEYAPDVNKILVGNGSDMDESKRAVPTSRGQALADEYGIKFFETSAKTNLNVEEAFFSLARDVMQRLSPPEADSIPMDRTIQVETSQRRHRNPLAYALQLLSRKK